MAISKDFLWDTLATLVTELGRVDPQSVVAARVGGLIEARKMGLATSDRHKRGYRAHDDKISDVTSAKLSSAATSYTDHRRRTGKPVPKFSVRKVDGGVRVWRTA